MTFSSLAKAAAAFCLASALAPSLVLSPAQAQSGTAAWAPMPNPDPRLAAMRQGAGSRLRAPGSLAISPDGAILAWTIGGREGGQLHLTELANPDPGQGQDRLRRRDHQLHQRGPGVGARFADPRLHQHLH